jgi:L-asparaginase II
MKVEVTRGDLVESFHEIAACVSNSRGNVVFASGDVDSPTYLRSSAKPFIAAAVIAAGAREAFGLDDREIAIMAGSHSGEPFHIEAVRSLLKKIGLPESAIRCGAHLPYSDAAAHEMVVRGEQPRAVHDNCSGKHAGILALCRLLDADTETYLERNNPAERAILDFCARASDDDAEHWRVGVDGCGIPAYATPLCKAALSFARLATLQGMDRRDARALEVVRHAMLAQPEYVAGTGELDTVLMQVAKGTIVAKGGAEGVHGVAVLSKGFGYVAKVVDGAARARGPATIALLRRIGALDGEQLKELARFERPAVYNRAGVPVGEIRAIV